MWASIEIIVGNFLHSFRIPFTGEILTFFAIYFLTSASVRWKVKGLIWRAGLICGMMKFFTPGVNVFGPIIGIISESFVFEFVLRIFGMNIFGFIIGGALTLCLPMVQKLINLLILYGWDLVVVFDKSIEFVFKIVNLHSIESYIVLIILFSVNSLFGGLAALLGYKAGKRKSDFTIESLSSSFNINETAIIQTENVGIIFLRLFLNASAIILILLFVKDYLLISALCTAVFIGYVLYRYKSSRRIFRNYKLWIQIVVFTALTTFVLTVMMKNTAEKSVLTGIEMFLRVLLITVGFNSISSEISKPTFTNFLRSKLNRNFSEALNLAFEAVPDIINSSKGITSILNPGKFINELTYLMEVWHLKFKSMNSENVIITGSQGAGKTTLIKNLTDENTAGVYSEVVYQSDVRLGYDAVLINNAARFELCRVNYESDLVLGKFGFRAETFSEVYDSITAAENFSTIIIDEIGLLEKNKGGWYSLLVWALSRKDLKVILSVRKDAVNDIMKSFPESSFTVYDLDETNAEEILKKIKD